MVEFGYMAAENVVMCEKYKNDRAGKTIKTPGRGMEIHVCPRYVLLFEGYKATIERREVSPLGEYGEVH